MTDVHILLTPRMVDTGDAVGCGRRCKGYLKKRKPGNALRCTFEEGLWFDRWGARCELAGKVWLNQACKSGLCDWNMGVEWDEKVQWGRADLAGFIDVKGVGKSHHRLWVHEDDNDDYAFLLVDRTNHPGYAIVGWLWGHEAKGFSLEDPHNDGRPAHYVKRAVPPMRDPQELFLEVQRRLS